MRSSPGCWTGLPRGPSALFRTHVIVGFGRNRRAQRGIVANQPLHFAGCLDIDASEKAARFVRPVTPSTCPSSPSSTCRASFLAPIRSGTASFGAARLIYAYAEATVPLVTVITRKAYGGAYDVMGSKHLGADFNLAWPTAQIAVMGAQGAVNILYRKEIAKSDQPEELRAELITEYDDELANPYIAAERGYVDAVISPHETRGRDHPGIAPAPHQAADTSTQEAREHSL